MTRRPVRPSARPRDGFTLIEMLVALALTGLVVLTAHAVLAQVSDATGRAQRAASDLDRAGNRRLWLVRAFANVIVGSAPVHRFDGRDNQVSFFSRLPVGDASVERRVHLGLSGDSLIAIVRYPPGPRDAAPETFVLADDVTHFAADFLIDYGASSPWVRDWVSPVSAPVAVRLRLAYRTHIDTLLLHVGPRG